MKESRRLHVHIGTSNKKHNRVHADNQYVCVATLRIVAPKVISLSQDASCDVVSKFRWWWLQWWLRGADPVQDEVWPMLKENSVFEQ